MKKYNTSLIIIFVSLVSTGCYFLSRRISEREIISNRTLAMTPPSPLLTDFFRWEKDSTTLYVRASDSQSKQQYEQISLSLDRPESFTKPYIIDGGMHPFHIGTKSSKNNKAVVFSVQIHESTPSLFMERYFDAIKIHSQLLQLGDNLIRVKTSKGSAFGELFNSKELDYDYVTHIQHRNYEVVMNCTRCSSDLAQHFAKSIEISFPGDEYPIKITSWQPRPWMQ